MPNPGQEDGNADGAGDACQPHLEILGVNEDGGATLEVTVRLADPDGDPVRGAVLLAGAPTSLADFAASPDCTTALPPEGLPGRGIVYARLGGDGYLLDVDRGALELTGTPCQDGNQDYALAFRSCASGPSGFDYFQVIPPELPFDYCVERADGSARFDITVLSAGASAVVKRSFGSTSYENGALPSGVSLTDLLPGRAHEIRIRATDGHTPPVEAAAGFVYHGEATLVFVLVP